MEGFSGLCKWVSKISDDWASPLSPGSKENMKTSDTSSATVMTSSDDLGSSLSPLHSSRQILAAYTDFTASGNVPPKRNGRSSKLSYSSLPLAADEMD